MNKRILTFITLFTFCYSLSTVSWADSSAPLTAGGDQVVARLPVTLLTDPPQYVREGVKPRWLKELQSYDLATLPDIARSSKLGTRN